MNLTEKLLIGAGLFLAVVLFALIVKAVVWVGRDARRRGFQKVWLLQVLTVIEFPWPWLMYYLVTRHLDRKAEQGRAAAQA